MSKKQIKNHFDIKPICIQRTNSYHDINSNEEIISASNIRNKIINSENIDTIREFQGLDAEQEFYLTDNGLVIYYQPYVYTTRSYGPLIVEIPYLRIYKIIRKEYLNLVAEDIDRTLVEQCGMFKLN